MKRGVQSVECGAQSRPAAATDRESFRTPGSALRNSRGFTLIELMMVVAIIGLMMATGVPAILSVTREAPLRKAVNDATEICSHARSQAILQGKTTTVVFQPRLRKMSLKDADATGPSVPATRVGRAAVNAAEFDPSVAIEGLGINNFDYTDSDGEAFVFFYADGTSDEMTLVLSSGGEYRKITLEVTTALASVRNVR